MSEYRNVVVMVTPEFLNRLARPEPLRSVPLRPLGLTGYGENLRGSGIAENQADMFAAWVPRHPLSYAVLEERHDASGLEWHWLDEYDGVKPVEMVRSAKPQSNATASQDRYRTSELEKYLRRTRDGCIDYLNIRPFQRDWNH